MTAANEFLAAVMAIGPGTQLTVSRLLPTPPTRVEIRNLATTTVDSPLQGEELRQVVTHLLEGHELIGIEIDERPFACRMVSVRIPDGPFEGDPERSDSNIPIAIGPGLLKFTDGSELPMDWSIENYPKKPMDQGPALLEPITAREYGELERVLQVLWQAIEADDLEPHHRIQVRMMYQALHDDHRDTTAEVTKRHGLVGTMRSIALFSNQEGMRAALAWWKIGEILHGINWRTVAGMLPGGSG